MIIICCVVCETRWQRSAQRNSLLSHEGTKQHKVNQAAQETGKTKFSRQNGFHDHETLPSLGVALPEMAGEPWRGGQGCLPACVSV